MFDVLYVMAGEMYVKYFVVLSQRFYSILVLYKYFTVRQTFTLYAIFLEYLIHIHIKS